MCGPFTQKTWDKKRSFVTFIDDFSHFTVVYLLESKDEVQSKFEEYCARVTAFFGTRVSRLRCDNGGEYTGKSFRKYCRTQGINVEATIPYSPQQNGVAERMNRTLLEKARSMVQEAGLHSMWGEAVLTAAYLCNRSPTSALKEKKTPYEIWYGRKPNIDKMRVFGSVAHTWVPKEKRNKLDPKSEKNVMVGYTANGYRIWDPRKRRVTVARDVVFDEQKDGSVAAPNDAKQVLWRNDDTEDCEDEPEAPVVGQPNIAPQPEKAAPDVNEKHITDDDEDDDTTLPSQPERVDCPAEATTRRSERERKLPGKFLDFITGSRASTATECSTGVSKDHDDATMAFALNAEKFVENLPTTIDGLQRRSDW